MKSSFTKNHSTFLLVAALFSAILFSGVSECDSTSMQQICSEAESMDYNLGRIATKLENISIFHRNQTAMNHTCKEINNTLQPELNGYIAFVEKSAEKAFLKIKTNCLQSEEKRVCRSQRSKTRCYMDTVCTKEQKIISEVKDGYDDAMKVVAELKWLKEDVKYSCSQVAKQDLDKGGAYFEQGATRIRGVIRHHGDLVMEKSGCKDVNNAPDGTGL